MPSFRSSPCNGSGPVASRYNYHYLADLLLLRVSLLLLLHPSLNEHVYADLLLLRVSLLLLLHPSLNDYVYADLLLLSVHFFSSFIHH